MGPAVSPRLLSRVKGGKPSPAMADLPLSLTQLVREEPLAPWTETTASKVVRPEALGISYMKSYRATLDGIELSAITSVTRAPTGLFFTLSIKELGGDLTIPIRSSLIPQALTAFLLNPAKADPMAPGYWSMHVPLS